MDEKFGKKARDKVTGLVGIITGKIVWMYGCNQYCIVPPVDKEGKVVDGSWFDEGRIEIIEDAIEPKDVQVVRGGADNANMPKAR